MTKTFEIRPGEKFALVTLPNVVVAHSLPAAAEVQPNYWSVVSQPLELAEHWKEWVGSVRAKEMAEASLCLCVKAPSARPGVLDGESAQVSEWVRRFYQGLVLTAPIGVSGQVALLVGAHDGQAVSVRQISVLDNAYTTLASDEYEIAEADVRRAALLAPVLHTFPKGKFARLMRVLNVFFDGVRSRDLRERLHQFCRVIEGLLMTTAGRTKAQFKSRTELFIGPCHHDLMDALYENRSAVEHMNDPVLIGGGERDRRLYFLRLAFVAETLARRCLLNVLTKPNLLRVFEADSQVRDFWSTPVKERQALWATNLDVSALLRRFEKTQITDGELGIG